MQRVTARRILLASVAVAAFSGNAQAVHFHGWYVGLEGGGVEIRDLDVERQVGLIGGALGAGFKESHVFDQGWTLIATGGYAFDNNWRLEAEAGYRANDISSIDNVAGVPIAGVSGSLGETTLMANLLYDLQVWPSLSVSLGFGLGVDRALMKTDGPVTSFNDSQWAFAYQGIVGLNQRVAKQWDIFLNYRYLRVVGPDFDANGTQAGPAHIAIHPDDIEKNTLTFGVRYDLWADEEPAASAPAAPPPMGAPPPPAHFIIFFGFNKCNITAEADSVLSEAASAAKSAGAASIKIVGHTDTSGSSKYNQKLSECRADAAKSNLVAKGVSQGAISAQGKGETELMVQTGDGVKEPQNRRATIDLK